MSQTITEIEQEVFQIFAVTLDVTTECREVVTGNNVDCPGLFAGRNKQVVGLCREA